MAKKKRLGWIDAAKGFAMLAVILGHTYLYGNPLHALIYSFNVPLFFILSGYTFRVKPIKDVLSSSAKQLLLPYLALCLFIIVVGVSRSEDKLHTLSGNLLAVIFASGGVIEQGNIPMLGLSWFLMALFVARVILNMILQPFEKRNTNPVAVCLVLIVLAIAAVFEYKYLPLPFAFDQAMVALLFMYIGYAAKKYDLVKKINVWIFAIITIGWLGILACKTFFSMGNMFYNPSFFAGLPMTILASFSIIKICEFFDGKIKRINEFFEFCGRNSLMLLVLHQFEGAFIDWSTISFAFAGKASFLLVGAAHLGIVLAMLWLMYLMPISIKTKNQLETN